MIKVRADHSMREELKRLADIFRGNIIDVTDASYTIEMTGDGHKMDAFISTLDPDLIIETVRSGPLGIARGGRRLAL
jgi:acetolactate synthase-1/3 small subunit